MVELERLGASPGGTVTNIRSLMSLEPHHVELERTFAASWAWSLTMWSMWSWNGWEPRHGAHIEERYS